MAEPGSPIAGSPWLRGVLLALMVLTLAGPIPLTAFIRDSGTGLARALAAPPLYDPAATKVRPKLTAASVWEGTFQQKFEAWFNQALEPRGWTIRIANQVYYSLFSKSYMYGRNIMVGRKSTLFERAYIAAYCAPHEMSDAERSAFVAKVRALREILARNHRPFLFVVTPSKAVVLPELLPPAACTPPADPEAGVRKLIADLRAAEIPVLDGPALVHAMKISDPLPPFPRGGTHWSVLTGERAAQQAMSIIDGSGADYGGIELSPPNWNSQPIGSDADLAYLMNLLSPPIRFSVGASTVTCRPTAIGGDTHAIVVGGSFTFMLLAPLANCSLFHGIDLFFYYTLLRMPMAPAGPPTPVDRTQLDWRQLLLGQPSALIVEANESTIEAGVPANDNQFLDDALAALNKAPATAGSPAVP